MFENRMIQFLKLIFKNIITVLIPSLITLIYTIPEFKFWLKTKLENMNCYYTIKAMQIPVTLIVLVIIPFVFTIISYIIQIKTKSNSEKFLSTLLANIDTVVGIKTARFYEYSKMINKKELGSVEIFKEIAKPIIQIQEIIKNVKNFFIQIYDDNTIKTSLLRITDKKHIEYFIYFDGDHKTGEEILNSAKSTAKICYNSKDIVIVDDTEKRNDKFIHSSNSNTKSIICFPIKQDTYVKFILCITSNTNGCFNKKQREKYKYILEQFEKRIILELYLNQIKESLNE